MNKYHETLVSDVRDIPDVLAPGVDRAAVEAEWNNVPLFEPPAWWDDADPPAWAGGKTWLRLLVDEWHAALLKPPTPEEIRQRERLAKLARAFEIDRTALAIECLIDKEASDRFRKLAEAEL